MKTETRPSLGDKESPYLQCLHALTGEIEEAIVAIASDDLSSFSESVTRQEVLASSLTSLRRALSKTPELIAPGSPLRAAERELQLVNLQYAALLKHFSRTIAMLSALCSSHAGEVPEQISGHIKEARGTRSRHQTWSCEM